MTGYAYKRTKDSVAICGFCETSRALAPYHDPQYEIWGLNRGYIFMPRADRWFDLHSPAIRSWHHRRDKDHDRYLKSFPGPVYLHEVDQDVPNSIAFPIDEVQEDIGKDLWRLIGSGPGSSAGASSGGGTVQKNSQKTPPFTTDANGNRILALPREEATMKPYFDSSIAYEVALAIHEGFNEIMVVGVDLNTSGEYVFQRSGISYLLGLAQGRGISVVLPDNCPLLQGNCYGRAYLMPGGEHMSHAQLETRLEQQVEELRIAAEAAAEWRGSVRETEFLVSQMIPGLDQEKLSTRLKQLKQQARNTELAVKEVEGGIKSTLYWIHQTPDGDPPSELAHSMDQRVNGHHGLQGEQLAEGDLSTFAPMDEPVPAGVN